MRAIKVTEKIYWVGAIDWNVRDFHGYSTNKGTTYNAFLILDDKITLIDTVKKEFYQEMLSRIKSVIDPKKVDIIISNHAELDHSGSLKMAIADMAPEHVYASVMGTANLKAHLGEDLPVEAIANGGSLDIGQDSLTFIESRMLHWPDSMICLLKKENVLFCNDIFGMHYASCKRFDDEVCEKDWIYEAKKYYANIILPYSKIVTAFLGQVTKLGIKPSIICPDHGPIWRKDPSKIINLYAEFAAQKNKNKVLVIYDTMWGSTEKMASSVTDGLIAAGVEVKQMSLHAAHRSDAATELLDSAGLVLGSPVLNQELYPSLGDLITYFKGLKKQNLVGAAFGSYGWSDGALNELETIMKEKLNIEIAAPAVKSRFVPTEDKLKECFELGLAVGKKVLEKNK